MEVKILKIYFEIKTGYIKLGLHHEAYKLFKKVYKQYIDNIFVTFEYLKLSIMNGYTNDAKSALDNLKRILNEKLTNSQDNDNNDMLICYLHLSDFIVKFSFGNYTDALDSLTKLMEISAGNVLVMNNMALINLYLGKVDKSINDFMRINDKSGMNIPTEFSVSNYSTLMSIIYKK